MAPARVIDDTTTATPDLVGVETSQTPTVYVIDSFKSQAIDHARTLFNVIQSTDAMFTNWQKKAKYILMRGSYLTAEDVANCPNLLAIGKHGVGIDKIDQKACAARGIKILNTPGANAQAVAEIVLALAMAVARQIPNIATRQLSAPVRKETCNGITLHGKTIGIVGMGNIGRKVAKMFHGAFEAPIIAYDPFMPADAWAEIPHQRVDSYQEMLEVVDVLTLHVPLTSETRDMISYSELQRMKKTAILINAARGGIVNEDDLTRALSEGLIWGAGLDAHEEEPPTAQKYGELWKLPNVVSTPHIGAATEDAQLASALGAVDNLYNYIRRIES